MDKKEESLCLSIFFSLLYLKACLTEFKSKITPYQSVENRIVFVEWGGFFLSSLLKLVGFRRSVKSTYSFHFRSTSCTSFCAQINSLIYCPTNSTTKLKGFHLSLSAISRLMVLSGFLLSDSVEREHQPPLIFSRYFKNVRATIKMNGKFSEFSDYATKQHHSYMF